MQRKRTTIQPYGITVKPRIMLHITESDYKHIVNEALNGAQDRCGRVDTEVEIEKDNDAMVVVGVTFDYDREYTDEGLGYIDVKTDIYNFSARVTGSYDGDGAEEECDFNDNGLEKAYNDIVRYM